MSAYCASKAALDQLAACLMLEVRHQGVKVTTSHRAPWTPLSTAAPAAMRVEAATGRHRRDRPQPAGDARRRASLRVELRPLRPKRA